MTAVRTFTDERPLLWQTSTAYGLTALVAGGAGAAAAKLGLSS